jgi:hypothetical protein
VPDSEVDAAVERQAALRRGRIETSMRRRASQE